MLWFAGCTTKPAAKQSFIFFPPAPDEPRVQFLTSFATESDLGGQGKLSAFVVGEEKFVRPIWKPYGITAAKGKLYICDTQPHHIVVVDLTKHRFTFLKGEERGAIQMPINVAVDKDGTRYVADPKRGQVLIFDNQNQFVAEVGHPGEMRPSGIVLAADRFYVSDLSNHCVRVFSKATRETLFTFPRDATNVHAKIFSPTNLAADDKGQIYVSDSGGFIVKVFDAEGNYLRTVGDVGLKPGRFALPKGIGVDHEEDIFVVDAATAVVQMFDKQGQLLMYFGEPQSSGPGALYLPAGLAVDYENVGLFQKYAAPGYKIDFLIFVTNQAGPQKVSVFGFMKKK
jgi:hypothetical protein